MTETRLTPGGVFTPSLALVSTDQETILGDGTPGNPIRLGSGSEGTSLVGTLFEAGPEDTGAAVRIRSELDFTFSKTTSSGVLLQAQAIGVVSEFNAETDEVTVATTGEVTLTTAEWDQQTGGSGGLSPGTIYYADAVAGTITPTQPAQSTQFVAQIGIARSTTTMLLSTPAFPEEVP